MKCYYEVLDVSRDANESEIKTAYRKLALKWHPDKNLDNSELAKEQFQVVQQAYEVLSDRQERAWYDNHREQIIRGSNSEFQDNCLDVFQYFTTSCFKGYDDSEKGFYTVYRKVFESIAKEDLEFIENKDEFCEIPSFGTSQSDYEEVVALFYAYWMSYSTKKSYVWLDPYNINEARERRVGKLIEKENKKVRQKAKKERNEEVRNLVAFVRKRDKRVQVYNKLMEERILENRKKQEIINKQKRLEQKKLNESAHQAEWAKFDNVKSELEEIEKHLAKEFGECISNSDSEVEEEESNLYCPACNKIFKTPKAFENHESSKKHKENVEKLRDQMLEEDDEFEDDLEEEVDSEDDDLLEDSEVNLSDSDSIPEVTVKQKKKKSKNVLSVSDLNDKEEVKLDVRDSEEEFSFDPSKKPKKKGRKSAKVKLKDESENAPQTSETENTNIINNKKQRKEKKPKTVKSIDSLSEVDVNHCCVTCKSNFNSKNKLFDHLKKTGHGVYIPKNVGKNKKNAVKD